MTALSPSPTYSRLHGLTGHWCCNNILAVSRTKILVIVSLAFVWCFASILPHYSPIVQATFKSRLDEARQKIPKISIDWHQSDDPRDAYNASKVALIVEPRPLSHLPPQLLHMISAMPPDWRLIFIGSEKSVISVGRSYAIKHQQVIGKLDLMVLPEPWEIDSKEKVYRLLTDMRFYNEFLPGVEWILKFEADSVLCANSQVSLNEWLDWDWAGAPRTPHDRFSGNGGLSLRRVSAIRRVLKFQQRYNNSSPEDEWFGQRMYILPGAKVASGRYGQLTVEDVYIDNAMGFHLRDGGKKLADSVWKDPDMRKKIFSYCPEVTMIMDMKFERERCDGDNRQGEIIPPSPTEEELRQQAEEAARKLAEQEAQKAQEEEARKQQGQEQKQEQGQEAKKPEEAGHGQPVPEPQTPSQESQ